MGVSVCVRAALCAFRLDLVAHNGRARESLGNHWRAIRTRAAPLQGLQRQSPILSHSSELEQ